MTGAATAALRSRRVRALAATAGAVALTAAPAAALSNATYKGKTSQGKRVSLVVSNGKIKRFFIVWNATCKSQNTQLIGLTTNSKNVSIGRHGNWNTSGRYSAPSGNGFTEKFSVREAGTIVDDKGARGTFTGTARVYQDSTGQYIGNCSSGRVTFKLKHVS